jgi:two-component system heavy metal sensor histidine kinase CusS
VRFDLAGEVRTLFDYFEALAEERQVTLALQGDTLTLEGDPQAWRRALGNLLSNALRYAPAGGQVVVRLGGSAGQAVVEVENPGPTIAPEHLPHLFDRFYRADPSRRNGGEGAGLGLAIVRSIVAAHGGTIEARSRDGRTCFTVVVPRPGAA